MTFRELLAAAAIVLFLGFAFAVCFVWIIMKWECVWVPIATIVTEILAITAAISYGMEGER